MQKLRRFALFVFLVIPLVFSTAQDAKQKGTTITDRHIPWIEEDARWISTQEEVAAFKLLQSDPERDGFIESFWFKRDPTPGTIENEFREEHYRRIVYANTNFGTDKMVGWATDRGRAYIQFGPPDEIVSGNRDGRLSQDWKYRFEIEVLGPLDLVFVDSCNCNAFEILGTFPSGEESPKDSPRLIVEHVVGPIKSPQPKFKDLQEMVVHGIRYNQLPFEASVGFESATHATTVVQLAIHVARQNVAKKLDERPQSSVNLYGQVTSLSGRVVAQFDDTASALQGLAYPEITSRQSLPLRPGVYRLSIAMRDANNDLNFGTRQWTLTVPTFEQLAMQGLKPILQMH